jgi:tetratricopeptide (TPR) repeat protein
MTQQPSVGLVLSYAAMEKKRNRRPEAMRVYEQGLKLFPSNAKLWEDAGALAFSLGELPRAIQFFEHALALSVRARQGTKGVLLKLAQASYQLSTFSYLKQALDYYRRAQRMGRNPLSTEDLRQMNVAAVRIQRQRGNVSIAFLEACGFRISRANLLPMARSHGHRRIYRPRLGLCCL